MRPLAFLLFLLGVAWAQPDIMPWVPGKRFVKRRLGLIPPPSCPSAGPRPVWIRGMGVEGATRAVCLCVAKDATLLVWL